MQPGSLNLPAPELRVDTWIDGSGQSMKQPLRLADLGAGYKLIYCFQHWCPGCHSHGFPTLQLLAKALAGKGFSFAVIQTVFEGFEENTADQLRPTQERYDLNMPFGHDVEADGVGLSSFMQDYQTGGTPWFTVIDPAGQVIYADFHLDPARFLAALGQDTGGTWA